MSEKHTPYTSAPWEALDEWIQGNPLDGDGGEACVIAQMHSGSDCALADCTDGNSRLIVAAVNSYAKHCGPRAVECAEADLLGELLEACKAAWLVSPHNRDRQFTRDNQDFDAAQRLAAVIAKAEAKP